MGNDQVTIKLTSEQQRQIKEATGKTLTELIIDPSYTGVLTQKELEAAAGGVACFVSKVR